MSDVTEVGKLVWDKTPERLEAKGVTAKFREAGQDEYEIELLEKLREEVIEFKNAKSLDELVDLLETVDAVISLYDWKKEDVDALKASKLTERGSFKKRLILEQTEG